MTERTYCENLSDEELKFRFEEARDEFDYALEQYEYFLFQFSMLELEMKRRFGDD